MTHSINQPWAVSDNFRNRYGDTWADIDFIFNAKISADLFREDPMNTKIGKLQICKQNIELYFKDLLTYEKIIQEKYDILISEKANKIDVFPIEIKSFAFSLFPKPFFDDISSYIKNKLLIFLFSKTSFLKTLKFSLSSFVL